MNFQDCINEQGYIEITLKVGAGNTGKTIFDTRTNLLDDRIDEVAVFASLAQDSKATVKVISNYTAEQYKAIKDVVNQYIKMYGVDLGRFLTWHIDCPRERDLINKRLRTLGVEDTTQLIRCKDLINMHAYAKVNLDELLQAKSVQALLKHETDGVNVWLNEDGTESDVSKLYCVASTARVVIQNADTEKTLTANF